MLNKRYYLEKWKEMMCHTYYIPEFCILLPESGSCNDCQYSYDSNLINKEECPI